MMTAPAKLSPADIIRSGLCIGCGVCALRPETRMEFDRYGQYKPRGPKKWLHQRTSEFARICPFSPQALNEDEISEQHFRKLGGYRSKQLGHVLATYVGYVVEDSFRADGSSGGMTSWILADLLRADLIDAVIHVGARDHEEDSRFFHYKISSSKEEILAGAKSRYYPVELSKVLQKIKDSSGRYAIVGVPCFIKSLRLLCREDPIMKERIVFTIGLFCGHMKSARLLESFAWQMGCSLSDVQKAEFRKKDVNRPASTYTAQLILKNGEVKSRDWWNMAEGDWGAGFFQNSACNFCDDIVAETADVSLGDAWLEPYSSDGWGTNIVIVRCKEILNLLIGGMNRGSIKLDPVDHDFVVRTQAAGFRHRREGLAYRLCWKKKGIKPKKRVHPQAKTLSLRRKLVYRTRAFLSAWSHRIFLFSQRMQWTAIYLKWARTVVTFYEGCTYSRGPWGRYMKWIP